VLATTAMAVLATACVRDLSDELGNDSMPRAINDSGVMAGDTDINHPVRFEPDRTRVPLDDPQGWDPMVIDINSAREVAGSVFDISQPGAPATFPVVWDDQGRMVDLRPMIPHTGTPGVQAYATDINDEGLLVGWMYGTDASTSPPTDVQGIFVVDTRAGTGITFAGRVAYAINDDGTVVGLGPGGFGRWVREEGAYRFEDTGGFDPMDIDDDSDMVGTIGSGQPAFWKHGDPAPTALPLDGLPEGDGVDNAYLGNDDTIVFNTRPADGSMSRRPVRWRTPGSRPELFPRGSWQSAEVWNLNNRGVALGTGFRDDGGYHAVRWDLT
jgi:hypothetical protein